MDIVVKQLDDGDSEVHIDGVFATDHQILEDAVITACDIAEANGEDFIRVQVEEVAVK